MSAVTELNRRVVATRADVAAAVACCQASPSSSSPPPFWDVASLCDSFLVRVVVPKKEFERLVLASAAASVGIKLRSDGRCSDEESAAAVAARKAALRTQFERGVAFFRVGRVQSVVLHVLQPNEPPTAFLLLDLGDMQDTFSLKQVAADTYQDSVHAPEMALFETLLAHHEKPLLSAAQMVSVERRLEWVRAHNAASANGNANTVAPGCFSTSAKYEGSSGQQEDASSGLGSEAITKPLEATIRQQRDLLQRLQVELDRKNTELFQLAMSVKDRGAEHEAEIEKWRRQVSLLSDQLTDIQKKQADKDSKLKPLLDAVRPLNQLLKVAREKLKLPQGPVDVVERALREATVEPRRAS